MVITIVTRDGQVAQEHTGTAICDDELLSCLGDRFDPEDDTDNEVDNEDTEASGRGVLHRALVKRARRLARACVEARRLLQPTHTEEEEYSEEPEEGQGKKKKRARSLSFSEEDQKRMRPQQKWFMEY
jgi:hypothetical protein